MFPMAPSIQIVQYLLCGRKSVNSVDGQNPALPIIRNIP